MSSYESLALRYDALTADVDHEAWADYLEKHFSRSPIPVHTVLDLACGTGAVTCVLARRGYEMIGVDLSAEMLMVAAPLPPAAHGGAGPLRHHRRLRLLPGQRELRDPAPGPAAGL